MQNNLYKLKQQYGRSIIIVKEKARETDIQTGRVVVGDQIIKISRAILMPKKDTEKAITYVAGDREIIIEAKDLQRKVELDTTCIIKIEDKIYKIKSIETLDDTSGFLITITNIGADID